MKPRIPEPQAVDGTMERGLEVIRALPCFFAWESWVSGSGVRGFAV